MAAKLEPEADDAKKSCAICGALLQGIEAEQPAELEGSQVCDRCASTEARRERLAALQAELTGRVEHDGGDR